MQDQDRDDNIWGRQDEPAKPQPVESQPPPAPSEPDDVDPWDLSESLRSSAPVDEVPASQPSYAAPLATSPPAPPSVTAHPEPVTFSEPTPAPAAPPFMSPFDAPLPAPPPDAPMQEEPAASVPAEGPIHVAQTGASARDVDPAYPPRKALPSHLTRVEPQKERPRVQPLPVPTPSRPPHMLSHTPQMVMTQPWIILKPRIWPSIVTVLSAFSIALMTSVVALMLAFLVNSPGAFTSGNASDSLFDWMSTVMPTKWGAALFTLPVQIPLLLGAVVAAVCSPEGFRQRLGLVASRYPWWTYPLFMLGAPIVAMAVSILGFVVHHAAVRNGVTIEPNDMELLIVGPAGLSGALTVVFLIAVMPAICEELLFRGLLQRRLLRRWPIVGAISLATGLFLLAHLNPLQMFVLIPLGTWLGVLAWQSGSIIPSILCHFANNAVAIMAARIFRDLPVGTATETMAVVGFSMIPLLLMFIGAIGSLAVVIIYATRYGPPTDKPLPLAAMRRVTTFNPPPDAIVYAEPQYAPAVHAYAPSMPAPPQAPWPAQPAQQQSAAPQRPPQSQPGDEYSLWG